MNIIHHISTLLILFVAAFAAFPAFAAEPLNILATVAPVRHIVQRIGGEHVDAKAMIPVASDPHTFAPKPGDMRAVAAADGYFSVDMGFEHVWLERFAAANPDLRVVDLADGLQRMPMQKHGHDHERGHQDENHGKHAEMDPHVWLSPRLVLGMAHAVRDELARLDPQHARDYSANLEAFEHDIRALDKELAHLLGTQPALKEHGEHHEEHGRHEEHHDGHHEEHHDGNHEEHAEAGRNFMVFHPAWGYLAADYGLNQVAIEHQGKEPSARELAGLAKQARKLDIRAILIQPQRSPRTAQAIADTMGARVITADPLAEDWEQNLLHVARELRKALY